MKSKRAALLVAAVAALVTGGCVTAAVAGGVVVVGAGAAFLASGCDEPVGVNVWDRSASHPICDATVVAERQAEGADGPAAQGMHGDGTVTTFSPCYAAQLGSGTWVVTATRDGVKATGLVTVSGDHKCNEPIYHSLELTLGTDASTPEPQRPPPLPSVPAPPGSPATPPAPTTAPAAPLGTAPAPATPPPAAAPAPAPPPAPAGTPAPSSSIPTAGFPSSPPAVPGPVPAPPTR
jgi:hypothetical protein